MTFIHISIVVAVSTLLVAWWLSRYDSRVVGDGRGWDVFRRILRCILTVAMVQAIFWCFWRYTRNGDAVSGLVPIPILLVLAFFWAGAVSEIFSRGFGKLFDSDGRVASDPRKGEEGLRQLSKLVEEGRQEEALRLSRKLRKSDDTNVIVLEAMLQRLGLDEQSDRGKLMAMARQLHGERRITEAERVLASLLERHPNDAQAAVFLIRIYTQDTHEPAKAVEVLRSLEQQSGISPGMIDFARSLLTAQKQPEPLEESAPASAPGPASVDELIAQRRFGSAIDTLKERLRDHPDDFETWLKLAEVNGRHCGSLQQVENIIRLLEGDSCFSPEQVQLLRSRLDDWRKEWKVEKLTSEPASQPPAPVAAESRDADPGTPL